MVRSPSPKEATMKKHETPTQPAQRSLEPRTLLRLLADDAAPRPPQVGGIWKPAAPRPRGGRR